MMMTDNDCEPVDGSNDDIPGPDARVMNTVVILFFVIYIFSPLEI